MEHCWCFPGNKYGAQDSAEELLRERWVRESQETEHLTGTEAANRCRWQMSDRQGDRWSRVPGLVGCSLAADFWGLVQGMGFSLLNKVHS